MRILKKMTQKISLMELESKVLLTSMASGMLICFFGAAGNMFLNFNMYSILIPFVMGLFYIYFLYALYYKDKYLIAAYGSLSLLTFIVFPFLWFFNGGLLGSIPYFYIFMILLSVVVLYNHRYKLMMVLQIAVVLLLIAFEAMHPEWIVAYENHRSQMIDVGYSLIIIISLVFVLMLFIMRSYHQTFRQLNETKFKLIELNRILHNASMTDELTQLHNRRYIITLINDRIAKKTVEGLHVLMLDIDHFKKINDVFGHSKGDDVLKRISSLLKSIFKGHTSVARLGGEEFLVVFEEKDSLVVLNNAERIRKAIESLPWREPELQTTVSIGVYKITAQDTIESILNHVDIALYDAKNQGRNQVVEFVHTSATS